MDDTIAAISSPSVSVGTPGRSIIRLSGPDTYFILAKSVTATGPLEKNTVTPCTVQVDDDFCVDAMLYVFREPASYTGQDLAELHLDACGAVVEAVLQRLCPTARPAAPGEFTQRAFLNGKLDLTQAEAVAQIVSSANSVQLNAAQRLLAGRFSQVIGKLRNKLIELIGKLEAGLDFSEEDIEFISIDQAVETVENIKQGLVDLLEGSVRCERMIDLDAVGLAGLPNAGKSSLANALLGQVRSIVSETEATTRDILTGVLKLKNLDCVLFDCAGLLMLHKQATLIDRLSHQTSLTALNGAAAVVFCVDMTQDDFTDDIHMRNQIQADTVIYTATKADRLDENQKAEKLKKLQDTFGQSFLLTSAQTGDGMDRLKGVIEAALSVLRAGDQDHQDRLTINRRHEQRLAEAVKALTESADEIKAGSTEIAAMLLRQGYESLGGLERENISETVLDHIFSHFCIGK